MSVGQTARSNLFVNITVYCTCPCPVLLLFSVKPSKPIIASDAQTTDGDKASFVCQVNQCRPQAHISFSFGNTVIPSTTESLYDAVNKTYTVKTTAVKTMNKADNGKVILCHIQHETLTIPLETSTFLNVHCK